jgi:hypothetical protein
LQSKDVPRVAILGLGIVVGTACGYPKGQADVLSFSNRDISAVVEAAGIAGGGVRTARRNADRSALQLEWVTKAGALLVQLRLSGDRHEMTASGHTTCPGWKCFADQQGQVVAWLEPPNQAKPQVAHFGSTEIVANRFSVDPSGRYFAIQLDGRRVELGAIIDPRRRCAASASELKGLWSDNNGLVVVGQSAQGQRRALVTEKYRVQPDRCDLGAKQEVPIPFEHFEASDYSTSPERVLVTELRDDPSCSRLWTWDLKTNSLVAGGCAMDTNFYAR